LGETIRKRKGESGGSKSLRGVLQAFPKSPNQKPPVLCGSGVEGIRSWGLASHYEKYEKIVEKKREAGWVGGGGCGGGGQGEQLKPQESTLGGGYYRKFPLKSSMEKAGKIKFAQSTAPGRSGGPLCWGLGGGRR